MTVHLLNNISYNRVLMDLNLLRSVLKMVENHLVRVDHARSVLHVIEYDILETIQSTNTCTGFLKDSTVQSRSSSNHFG